MTNDEKIAALEAENKGLKESNAGLVAALVDLRDQVERFCVENGEWDFYIGEATRVLFARVEPRKPHD